MFPGPLNLYLVCPVANRGGGYVILFSKIRCFYVIFGVKYMLKMPKYGKICDSEIQISRGCISGKASAFKPFITQILILKGGSVWHGDPDVGLQESAELT